ncbi:unnamed protein product [Cylicocyclus nassatus]|uniref:Uncharacterized protein n=1 Tax=Cylicocyclus nassatus TaxID=53992 RepID=A0AA36GXV8_CYLNA|nr:unnamed protein product [Cylicocyclus nassatus]
MHVHAALILTSDGRRMFEVSEELVEATQKNNYTYIVFEESIQRRMKKNGVTVDNDEEDEPESDQLRRRSTDNRDPYGDLILRIIVNIHIKEKN